MLTERQLEIVLAVVYEYIATGEPVGSRTISKKYLKGCSAATVRNEMADLNEMGYLYQPHTSAGRLPTPLSYRVYVNSIMHRRRIPPPGLESWVKSVKKQRRGVETVLAQISRLLGRLTSYLGVAVVSAVEDVHLQKVDFVRIAERLVLVLVVLEGGMIHHRQITLDGDLSQKNLDQLAETINRTASGKSWNDVKDVLYGYITNQLEEYWSICKDAVDRLDLLLVKEKLHLSTGGVSQVFNVPDFADMSRLQMLLSLVEEEKSLVGMIRDCSADEGVMVTIGSENSLESMKDCSVVMASVNRCGSRAVVGLIGPIRMNYEHSISVLEAVLEGLSDNDEDEG